MNDKLKFIAGVIFLTLTIVSCSNDGGEITDPPIEYETIVIDLTSEFTGEVVGESKLTRIKSGLLMEVTAKNLIPGHVYNLVCAVFNKPKNCEGICDATDFQENNSGVEAVSFLVAGIEASKTTEVFTAKLEEGDITSFDMTSNSGYGDHGGLQDAQKAFIVLLIKSQGPAQIGQKKTQQLTTFGQACSFNNYNILDPNARIPEEIGECALISKSRFAASN